MNTTFNTHGKSVRDWTLESAVERRKLLTKSPENLVNDIIEGDLLNLGQEMTYKHMRLLELT